MSFISVEPQSRVFLESHSNTLLAQFDTQLEIVANRYLAFFQERSVNAVRVLHFTLTVPFSGEVSKQSSQFPSHIRTRYVSDHFFSLEVSTPYGNSIKTRKP